MTGSPADRHRAVSDAFTEVVRGVGDWDAPTPVPEWRARDVIDHLVTWSAGFVEGGAGVRLPRGPGAAVDPVATWEEYAAAVQALLDDPATADRRMANPHLGDLPLPEAIDRFYTSDVFLHTWDLARATGQDDRLEEATCAAMLAGMEPMEEAIRTSGHYGPRVPVPDDASAQDRLLGFIGRDPGWRPPAD